MRQKIHHSRPSINHVERGALSEIMQSRYIASGEVTKKFEKRFARYLNTRFAIATNSGTSAFHAALLAVKIKPRDEIILPSFVCTAVLNAVLYVGAKPVIADIDLDDCNISIEDTKSKITKKTKAIIVPHMFGKPAAIDRFLKLGVCVIENCAQTLGARYRTRHVGTWGHLSTFSFYATKMIATGYGGMVCSKNTNVIHRIRDLLDVDEREKYEVRFNYRMSDIAAALGICQLKKLNNFIAKRRKIAQLYNQSLRSKNILIPDNTDNNHTYFRYVVKIAGNINRIIRVLNKKGIETKRPVFKPLHHYLHLDRRKFPNTEAVYHSALSLPIYPSLQKAEAKFIVQSLLKAVP